VFDQSLLAVAPLGRLVYFGKASRINATPVVPTMLMGLGVSVIGFWVFHVIARRPELYTKAIGELFGALADGSLRALDGAEFPLDRAADAHRALLSRATTGKLILTP
jgi:NADPH2:quinone reductase